MHLTVGTPEQGGQYATVQAAVDAVPAENTERHIIDIMPGTYTARVKVPATKPFITLRGEDPLTTKLTFNETQNSPGNEKYVHASTVVAGKDFIAEDLTFEKFYRTGAVALALYANADRMIFNNCRFLGCQDTLRRRGRHYFYNSYVEGTVDFIYGKGKAYFENSTLFAKWNGYLTAQGRETAAESNGYVFKNSTITGDSSGERQRLSRPTVATILALCYRQQNGADHFPAGWSAWSGNTDQLTAYFAEYNSMDLTGNPLDVSQRAQLVAPAHRTRSGGVQQGELAGRQRWLESGDRTAGFAAAGRLQRRRLVDAADYTVWRDAVSNGASLENETASMGVADEEDFAEWKSNFGATKRRSSRAGGSLAGAGDFFVDSSGPGRAIALRRGRTAVAPVRIPLIQGTMMRTLRDTCCC